MTKDPVCFDDVEEREALELGLSSVVNGQTYYFCSEECQQRFDRDPGVYMQSHGEWDESGRIVPDEPSY